MPIFGDQLTSSSQKPMAEKVGAGETAPKTPKPPPLHQPQGFRFVAPSVG